MGLIVLDTSAIVAILFGEPDEPQLRATLRSHTDRRMSSFSVYELNVVMWRRIQEEGPKSAEEFIYEYEVHIENFDTSSARDAFAAYEIYGKGSGHEARLNLGDCAAYALAKSLRAPLLFKGDDFAKTDVRIPNAGA